MSLLIVEFTGKAAVYCSMAAIQACTPDVLGTLVSSERRFHRNKDGAVTICYLLTVRSNLP